MAMATETGMTAQPLISVCIANKNGRATGAFISQQIDIWDDIAVRYVATYWRLLKGRDAG